MPPEDVTHLKYVYLLEAPCLQPDGKLKAARSGCYQFVAERLVAPEKSALKRELSSNGRLDTVSIRPLTWLSQSATL